MAAILRGDVRWADLAPTKGSEQAGRRPVVILSEDTFNDRSGTVIAMAITSREPKVGFPLALELTTPRLPKRSWVKISQIRTDDFSFSPQRAQRPRRKEEIWSRFAESDLCVLRLPAVAAAKVGVLCGYIESSLSSPRLQCAKPELTRMIFLFLPQRAQRPRSF
jgi:mRNA interferase MazF